jgi:histone-arginine methyltransferase CARM1
VNASNLGRSNPHIKNRIRVVRGMVENEKVQEEVLRTGKVDTIVSEPIGVMLLHERMVSSAVVDFVIILVVGGSKTWS